MIDPVGLAGIAGAPLVIALVALVRETFPGLATRYVPVVTLAVGIILNLFLGWYLGGSLALAVLVGVVTGLTASGLYSHVVTSGLWPVAGGRGTETCGHQPQSTNHNPPKEVPHG